MLAAIDYGLPAGPDQLGRLVPQVAGKVPFPALLEDGLLKEEHVKTAVHISLEGLLPR